MGGIFKGLAILSILAFFFCAGWVVVTADGVAFRYFLLSALIFVFSVFGGFSYIVWREIKRDKEREKAELEKAQKALKDTIDRLTKQNLN